MPTSRVRGATLAVVLSATLLAPPSATASRDRTPTTTQAAASAHHRGRTLTFNGQTPQLRGAGQVGTQLRVTLISSRDFSPHATKLKYQWLRLGKRIPGAHRSSYKVAEKDRARRLRCVVIGWKNGWQPRRVKTNVVKIAR